MVGDSLISHAINPEIHFDEAGLWDISLHVVTEVGCTADTTIQQALQVNPSPVANFSVNTTSTDMHDALVSVNNTSSADAMSWTYNFGDGSVEHFMNGDHLYSNWGEFTIEQTVANVFGCTSTRVINVHVSPRLIVNVPNAFTPDGNGHNETFYPVLFGDDITLYEFTIFDRWGNKVFHSVTPNEGWDGVYLEKAEGTPQAEFTWQLTYRGTADPIIHEDRGSVLLLK